VLSVTIEIRNNPIDMAQRQQAMAVPLAPWIADTLAAMAL